MREGQGFSPFLLGGLAGEEGLGDQVAEDGPEKQRLGEESKVSEEDVEDNVDCSDFKALFVQDTVDGVPCG